MHNRSQSVKSVSGKTVSASRVTIQAEVSFVGRTSMEAEVQVTAENSITGERTHTNTAYLVYVALDETGHPVSVLVLIPENEEQRLRMEEGERRQAYRLAQSKLREAKYG